MAALRKRKPIIIICHMRQPWLATTIPWYLNQRPTSTNTRKIKDNWCNISSLATTSTTQESNPSSHSIATQVFEIRFHQVWYSLMLDWCRNRILVYKSSCGTNPNPGANNQAANTTSYTRQIKNKLKLIIVGKSLGHSSHHQQPPAPPSTTQSTPTP